MAVSMLVSSVLSLRTPQLRIADNQAGTNYWSAPTKFEPGYLGRWAVSSYKGPAIRRKRERGQKVGVLGAGRYSDARRFSI